MPIFGVCQSACSLAMRLGGEFSVIGILEDMDRCIKENLRRYGMISMLANIPVVDTPVLELHEHVDEVVSQNRGGGRAHCAGGQGQGAGLWLYWDVSAGGRRPERACWPRH